MRIEGEFYLLETEKSDTFSTYTIFPADQPGDPRENYADQIKFNKRVRLLRCVVTETVRESAR
jgi:hypothetical protein